MTDNRFRIDIFCDNAAWHGDKRPEAHVMTYVQREDGSWETRLTSPSARRREAQEEGHHYRTTLVNDRLPRDHSEIVLADPEDIRQTEKLMCNACRRAAARQNQEPLNVKFRDHRDMNETLDLIKEAGVTRVSLKFLARRLSARG